MADQKPFDFSLFSDAQLLDLARQVDREILRRRRDARQLVRERGGIFEGEAPRYRNPLNSAQTWSGRGKQPAWVSLALESGMKLEDLERDDNRPVKKPEPRKRERGE